MAQPLDKKALLRFKFYVPATLEIVYRGTDVVTAATALAQGLQRGEVSLHVRDLNKLQLQTFHPEQWDAKVEWQCPDCSKRHWFDLRKRNCYGTCLMCKKKWVVVEGYAYWHHRGCDSCPKRLECLLIPRLNAEQVRD